MLMGAPARFCAGHKFGQFPVSNCSNQQPTGGSARARRAPTMTRPRHGDAASRARRRALLRSLASPRRRSISPRPTSPRERPATGRVCSIPRGQARPQRAAADCRGHRRALLGGALAARGPLRVTTPGRRSCGSVAHCSERAPLTLGDRREPLDDCGVALVARSSTEHSRESRSLCRLWWHRVAAAAAACHQPANHWPRRRPPSREGRRSDTSRATTTRQLAEGRGQTGQGARADWPRAEGGRAD